MAKSLTALLCILSVPEACLAGSLHEVLTKVRGDVNSADAMEYMRKLYARDRRFTFPQFEKTAVYMEKTLRSLGLEQVEVVRPLADGATRYGFWTMPLAWDTERATLEVMEPEPPEMFRILADFQQEPFSLGMWSGPTPRSGVIAEVIDVWDWPADRIRKLDLKGKVVLPSRNPGPIKWLLVERGALGAINAYTENPDLRDDRQWINAWGDRGWGFTKDNAPLFLFSITPRQTEWLRAQMGAGKTVRVRATVESRYYEGGYPYVTGIIPGSGSAEEVLLLGHNAEPGAQDNATGVAAMVEAVGTLNRLIRSGGLPRPGRSIRLLTMPEMYGTSHYLAENPERMRNTVAAFCLDTPAGFYHLAGTEYTFHLNPDVAKSFVDAFTMRLAEQYFGSLTPARPFHGAPYTMGTDSFLSEPMIGIPTVWPYSGSGVHTHHNSADTPDDVDPRSLRDLTVVAATYAYYLAAAGEEEAGWLAELALARGYRQILSAADEYALRARKQQDQHALRRLLYDGLEKLEYTVDRHAHAVESVRRVAPAFDGSGMTAQLEEFGNQQSVRLRKAAQNVLPAPPPHDPQLKEAGTMVVRRKRFGSITMDDLPVEEREGWPPNVWNTRLATVMYWCDGQRSVAEAVRLTRLELGPDDFDYLGYFRFLAEKGYVELRVSQPQARR